MAAGQRPDPRHPHWHRNFHFDPPVRPQDTTSEPHGPNLQPTNRHVGDGFDFRRPVMSQPVENIIDLTDEPSSPRGQAPEVTSISTSRRANRARRTIVDLEDDDDTPEFQSENTRRGREPSPEIELLYSRPLSSAARPRSHSVADSVPDGERARNAAGSAASMVERAMAGLRRNIAPYGRALNRSFGELPTFGGVHNHVQHPHHHHHHDHHHHHHRHDRHAHQVPNNDDLLFLQNANLDLVLPHQLDFETQGFHMGRTPRSSVPPPTYDPPPAPRPGFTRTPKEEEILICPNCNEELGVGEDELKRQVWLIKGCGHVS